MDYLVLRDFLATTAPVDHRVLLDLLVFLDRLASQELQVIREAQALRVLQEPTEILDNKAHPDRKVIKEQ